MMEADKAILMSAVVTLGSTVGSSVAPERFGGRGELPAPRLLIGTGLTFMGLSMLGEVAPRVAVPLSAAVALTAAMYYGIPLLNTAFDPKADKTKKPNSRKGKIK